MDTQIFIIFLPVSLIGQVLRKVQKASSLDLAAWKGSSWKWRQREYVKALKHSAQIVDQMVHRLVVNQSGISGLAEMSYKFGC